MHIKVGSPRRKPLPFQRRSSGHLHAQASRVLERDQLEPGRTDDVFAQMDPNGKAFPDGLTVDAEGGVWSNQVGLGKIVRYLPSGRLERTVQLPVPRATGCTFGGELLDTLYITSARETLSKEELKAAPLSGSLFAVRPGVVGMLPIPIG